MIQLMKVSKIYKNNKEKILNNINYSFDCNKLYAILGSSGSGKTSLINIIGLLDKASFGEIMFNGVVINKKNKLQYMRNIGFVFQSQYINENLNVYDNVLTPLLLNKQIKKNERNKKILSTLKLLHLEDKKYCFPCTLSGGEKQRVAIAVALISNPQIILADEPTSNLDAKNEKEIFKIFKSLASMGKCIIIVSHSEKILEYADQSLYLEKGKIRSECKC